VLVCILERVTLSEPCRMLSHLYFGGVGRNIMWGLVRKAMDDYIESWLFVEPNHM
jgi:hypothetical protein